MTSIGLSMILSCLAALFDVHSIALPGESTYAQLADLDSDGTGDIIVAEPERITAYRSGKDFAPMEIPLSKTTAAFDIADIDGDGTNELIGVCGDRIQRYDIAAENAVSPPRELFAAQTLLAGSFSRPYPQVIAVKQDGKCLLALPCSGALEVRTIDGAVVARYPTKSDTNLSLNCSGQLLGNRERKTLLDDVIGMKVDVNHTIEYLEPPPDNLRPSAVEATEEYRLLYNRYVMPDGPKGNCYWWFPLKTDGVALSRALCSFASFRQPVTSIRISEAESEVDMLKEKWANIGPVRRYPGNAINSTFLPDFNNDGYTDLLLWKAPMPGVSADSLTRAISGGVWPIEIVAHLYSPEKKRFNPAPCAQLSLNIPVNWFLVAGPVRNDVLRDLDGDGRTDLACSTSDRGYAAWLFTEKGFSRNANFEANLPEKVQRVEFAEDLEGKGRTTIALRAGNNLHILRVP